MNPIKLLKEQGQSIWLDSIRRGMFKNGELEGLVTRDGLSGMTSNPAIFEKAIGGSDEYDSQMNELFSRTELGVKEIYERLAISDIQMAADIFSKVYRETSGQDGYVSLEVSPYLAFDTKATIEEARRLWKQVNRPNVMIKVPGTTEGTPAIEALIAEGINVNVTLLFSQTNYEAVAEAYLRGLERRVAEGKPVQSMASVASFFVSRIDTLADSLLNDLIAKSTDTSVKQKAESLLGKVAIANAKLAYRWFGQMTAGARWKAVAAKGARPQRLLWASTSTKNPEYRDVRYIEELIGPETVNTVPPATLTALLDHGKVKRTLTENVKEAERQIADLEGLGISLKKITDKVLADAVRLFCDPFDKLLSTLEKKRQRYLGSLFNSSERKLPEALECAVEKELEQWRSQGKIRRLWAGDTSLWTGGDENKWLGWLTLVPEQLARVGELVKIAREFKGSNTRDVVLLGMGGSSLAPEVFETLFEPGDDYPDLHVLDSTDPEQIRNLESKLELKRSFFIVSSKSGTTLEPNLYFEYFYNRMKEAVGEEKAGGYFLAITDPGSALERVAKEKNFRHLFHGVPSVGGRYSALSDFGLVPAAIMGVDVKELLERALMMVHACDRFSPPCENPGVQLGVILGVAGKQGRDKVTLISSPEIWDVGSWLEQLLAESTGKLGRGLIPVAEEEVGSGHVYGEDRLFVYLKLEGSFDADLDLKVAELISVGQPVVTIHVNGSSSIGQEFFRWEIATAVAGSILGINPFDQPDVEASKVATRELTSEYEKVGSLPQELPLVESTDLKLFADPVNAKALAAAANGGSIERYLQVHLSRLQPHDYFCLLAYLDMSLANEMLVQDIRHLVRDTKRVATCAGFGPRFLHSTGQAYKGGPNSGVFLQITCDEADDLPVPGHRYTFGVVKAAQARGDLQVLADRKRRALRVHLGKDVEAGLIQLKALVSNALKQDWEGETYETRHGGTGKDGREHGSAPVTRRT